MAGFFQDLSSVAPRAELGVAGGGGQGGYFPGFSLNTAISDFGAGRNVLGPEQVTSGSGENMGFETINPSASNFTWIDPSSGQKFRVTGTQRNGNPAYDVQGLFDVGPKGLMATNTYDPTGRLLGSTTRNRGKSYGDLLGAGAILAAPFLMGGAQALMAGGGAAAAPAAVEAAAPAFTGQGLSLGGGGLGLTGTSGAGMSLAGGGSLGITAASPGASLIGAGIGDSLVGLGGVGAGAAAGGGFGGGSPELAGGADGFSDFAAAPDSGAVDLGSATGADMDAAFSGTGMGGGAAAALNPTALESVMGLIKSGGLSSSAVRSFLGGAVGGGASNSPFSLLSGANGALGFGGSLGQFISGLESRKRAKQLAAQMAGAIPPSLVNPGVPGSGSTPNALPYTVSLPNPADITSIPGYEAGMEAVRRSLASQGYQGSGNMMIALQKYGGDFYDKYVTQRNQANALQLMANQGQLAAANSQLGATQAQAGPAIANASALPLLINGGVGLLRSIL